jgi:flagellar motor switch/type III secretory pathway protein FliN
MNSPVRAVVLVDDRALACVRDHAQAALASWGGEWLGAPPPPVHAALAEASPRHETFEQWQGERGGLWIRWEAADDARLVEAVAGPSALRGRGLADDWIAQVARRARRLRNAALCAALAGGTAAEPAEPATTRVPRALFASGAGTVRIELAELGLLAFVERAAWQGLPQAARGAPARELPAPVPLESALARAALRLDVMLGSVEIELPRILQLRCGDVLRLPRRLDEPLAVSCAGRPLAHAVLGERHGRRSVQLLAPSPEDALETKR